MIAPHDKKEKPINLKYKVHLECNRVCERKGYRNIEQDEYKKQIDPRASHMLPSEHYPTTFTKRKKRGKIKTY